MTHYKTENFIALCERNFFTSARFIDLFSNILRHSSFITCHEIGKEIHNGFLQLVLFKLVIKKFGFCQMRSTS